MSPRGKSIFQALLVTFLWSTSWVLIKFGLRDLPALSFAGLRYLLAAVCLLPLLLGSKERVALKSIPMKAWLQMIALGLLVYSITQGAMFFSLAKLPAVLSSLILSFTPVLVAFTGGLTLGERVAKWQWAGIGLYLMGVWLYLFPFQITGNQFPGLAAAMIGLVANAASALLGRHVNRNLGLSPAIVTVVSMGAGSVVLFSMGILLQGLPPLRPTHWLIIVWLAAVNSAFAFTLWNRILQTLSAVESSVINNTMLFQIAILAWLFLGEDLSLRDCAGLAIAMTGVLLVQIQRRS
jgi:drug/metabolite transporter (DMT)-like permease